MTERPSHSAKAARIDAFLRKIIRRYFALTPRDGLSCMSLFRSDVPEGSEGLAILFFNSMFLTSLLIDEDQDLTIIRKQFLDNQFVLVNAFVFRRVLFGEALPVISRKLGIWNSK